MGFLCMLSLLCKLYSLENAFNKILALLKVYKIGNEYGF